MKAPIEYLPGILNKADADELFTNLSTKLNWEKRDAPRQEYYCNDVPAPYIYGTGAGERTYLPQPFTPDIRVLRLLAEMLANAKLEVCFINRYLNQKDQLGWHSDNSPEMDDARPIVIISLGVEREIWFRDMPVNGVASAVDVVEKLKLGHGSVCIMAAGMQDTHQHRIPKASFECGERISLTFRGYVAPK